MGKLVRKNDKRMSFWGMQERDEECKVKRGGGGREAGWPTEHG